MLFYLVSVDTGRLVQETRERTLSFSIQILMSELQKAVRILKQGGVIAYPTDTVYGIGCNVFNERAVRRVFEIKKRDPRKPLSVAVSDFLMLKEVVEVSEDNRKICEQLLPGPFTVLLPKIKRVPEIVSAGRQLLGVRIPDHKIAIEIIKRAGFPIITTSANLSGEPPPVRAQDINLAVDYIVKGECYYKKPSTVIDLVRKKIIRPGSGIVQAQKVLGKI